MANRLSKIVTRTEDKKSTGHADGTRVEKYCAHIYATSSIDKLNSHLSVLQAKTVPEDVRDYYIHVKHDLFDLGGALA